MVLTGMCKQTSYTILTATCNQTTLHVSDSNTCNQTTLHDCITATCDKTTLHDSLTELPVTKPRDSMTELPMTKPSCWSSCPDQNCKDRQQLHGTALLVVSPPVQTRTVRTGNCTGTALYSRRTNHNSTSVLNLTSLVDDVEQDDADLVVRSDVLVQQNGHNVAHVILDLLSIGICPHGQVLGTRQVPSSGPEGLPA